MSNVLFVDTPAAASAVDARTTPASQATGSSAAVRRPSAYLMAIDPSLGAPAAGPSAYLRAIHPSLAAPATGSSRYLRAIAGGVAR